MALLWQSRRLGRAVARRKRDDLGRGRAGALRHAVDGQDPRQYHLHAACRHNRHPAHICGAACAAVPKGRIIDGKDIRPLLFGQKGASCPHQAYYYYWNKAGAIRSGPWKLHFPHEYRSLKGKGGTNGKPAPYVERTTGLALYNLDTDVGETKDVSRQHPDVVARLEKSAQAAREDLGDTLTKWKGKNTRPPGKL